MEIINYLINAKKEKISRLEQLISEALKLLNDKEMTIKSLDEYYCSFKGWASEFDEASHERKKMIVCNLIII